MAVTRKARWMLDGDGAWACLLMSRPEAEAMVSGIETGKEYEVTVKERRKRRSLDANAYFWVLCSKLAEKTNTPKLDIYRCYIRDIGGNCETVCIQSHALGRLREGWEHNGLGWIVEDFPSKLPGCVNVTLYYGSSTYDTAQMSRLIDLCIQDCKQFGIETLTPLELARMMEGWDAQPHKGASNQRTD